MPVGALGRMSEWVVRAADGSGPSEPLCDFLSVSARAIAAGQAGSLREIAERHPVLGYGSNASPQQLSRKFAHFSADADPANRIIPVLRGFLSGFDVVFVSVTQRKKKEWKKERKTKNEK